METLNAWIQSRWIPILSFGLIFNILTRRRLGVIIFSNEDALKILRGN